MQILIKLIGDSRLVDIIDSIPFGDTQKFEKLKKQFPQYDIGFLWLLAYSREGNSANREYVEASFIQFRQVLDKQFPLDFPKQGMFISRMWELVLCDILSSSGKIDTRTKQGPDFLLNTSQGESIYIEAVAPDESIDVTKRVIRPDYTSGNVFSLGGEIEELERPVLMRVFNNGLVEKAIKKHYEINRPFVIAINSSKVVGSISIDEYILRRLLFGLGYVTISPKVNGKSRVGLQQNKVIKLPEGDALEVGLFHSKKYEHVSGIIYTSKSPLGLLPNGYAWSKESVVYVPNPNALYPIKTIFPFFKKIICNVSKYKEIPARCVFKSVIRNGNKGQASKN